MLLFNANFNSFSYSYSPSLTPQYPKNTFKTNSNREISSKIKNPTKYIKYSKTIIINQTKYKNNS